MELIRSPVPLYYQLQNIIREKIKTGEYKHDNQIPSEHEFCRTYKVSRQTVRHALKNLEKEGLLKSIPGKGYFVTPEKQWFEYEWLIESLDDLLALEKKARYKSLSIDMLPPTPLVAKRLSLNSNKDVIIRFKGVWTVKKDKIAYTIVYLPHKGKSHHYKPEMLKEGVLTGLNDYLNRICEAKQHTIATLAEKKLSRILNITEGEPILLLERVYFSNDKAPIFFAQGYYPSRFYIHQLKYTRKP